MSYKAILQELIGTAYNIPEGELSELFTKSDEELTDEDDKSIVSQLSKRHRDVLTALNKTAQINANKAKDDGFKAGERKRAAEYETMLKEKFGVDSDKQGDELVSEIVEVYNSRSENQGTNSQGKSKQITEEDVKKHPAYKSMETSLKTQLTKAATEKEEAIENLKKDYTRKEVFDKFSKYSLTKFDSMRPVLSEDAEKAQAQRELLIERLKAAGYEIQEAGPNNFILVDAEGNRITDEATGAEVDTDEFITKTAQRYFDFKVAEGREGPNSKNGSNGNTGNTTKTGEHAYKGKLPSTEVEYAQLMNDRTLPINDKRAIINHWEKQTAKAQ